MFGIFKKIAIQHSVLGLLTRHGKEWVGQIEIPPGHFVQLAIEGTREAPYAEALDAALQLSGRLSDLIPAIAQGLLEHLEPYRDALSDPESGYAEMLGGPNAIERIQGIVTTDDAWAAIEICGVEIGLAERKVRALIKLQSIWDEEHTLGAFFDDWQFMELNGSV